MDRLTLISSSLFLAADMFAIVSLAMPDWIITDVGGKQMFLFFTPLEFQQCNQQHPNIKDLKRNLQI